MQDDSVVEEQNRVKKVIQGQEEKEALTVYNLKKFFITKK